MEDLPEDVRGLLERHPALELIPGNKVRFMVTGHELPCRLPELRSFTEGKKYQRLTSRPGVFDYSKYEPHIVPSTKNGHQLFCKLTLRHINKVPEHVERHVRGKRFVRALHMYEDCKKRGVAFVPACLKSKKKQPPLEDERAPVEGDVWAPKDGHSEHSDSEDSMSDLYPDHMFSKKVPAEKENGNLQSASEEEMEVDESSNRKRPQKQNGSSRKKFKSHHKKPKTSRKL
ncbi:surfeit locus protein 2 isoform X2 [Phyllobates terribilis]|uniref:surfeit locus protein 2 isoform X2 n=1 Tax=Phyllobates terribilis TaxID=111132 RepID=UPI003CCA7416